MTTPLPPVVTLARGVPWSTAALGTDESWRDGDDEVGADGDTVEITGERVLVQDLVAALSTPLGSYVLQPNYGSRLWEFVNQAMDAGGLAACAVAVEECCERDGRIEEARASCSMAGEVVQIALELSVAGRTNPLNLVVGWDLATLSVEVINGSGV